MLVVRMHGNLCAAAGLAHDSFSNDNAVRHLGHLGLEELDEEVRMRAGEPDERATHALVHAKEYRPHALALAVSLTGYLFVVGENGGRAAEIHIKIPAFETLDVSCYYLTFTLAIFGNNARTLRFANLLHDDLFCGLCGDAAEVLSCFKWKGNFLVQDCVFLNTLCVFYHYVLLWI